MLCFCFTLKVENRSSGFESRLLATCWMHVATGVAFPQKSESTTSHQRREYKSVLSFVLCGNKKARIRANLKSHVSWYQPSLSLRDISPRGRDKFGLRVRANKFAPTSRLSLWESWHLRSK